MKRFSRDAAEAELRLCPSFLERPHTLPELLEWRAREDPNKLAIVAADGRMTYEIWACKVRAACQRLLQRGVRPGDHVGLWVGNEYGCGWSTALLAIQWMGAIPVPLSSRLPGAGVKNALQSLQSRHVVAATSADFMDDPEISSISIAELVEANESAGMERPACHEDDAVCIFRTSGTTGLPKAAVVSHIATVYMAAVQEEFVISEASGVDRLSSKDVIQTSVPMHTASGVMHLIALSLFSGCQLVIEKRFDATSTVETMQQEKSTIWFCVPAMMRLVADRFDQHIKAPHLRIAWHSGSLVDPELVKTTYSLFGGQTEVLNLYSLTETVAGIVSCATEDARSSPGCAGRPTRNTRIRVTNERGTADAGELGEIWFDSPFMFDRYEGNPEASREVFSPDGWLTTGDLGYFDESGVLWIVGRAGDVIVRGGLNINPAMVEQVLSSFPGVIDAAVVPVPHRVLGQDLAAFVAGPKRLDIGKLQTHCRNRLADNETPRRILVVDTLPRNEFGKLDRRALRERATIANSRDATRMPRDSK